MPPREPDDFDDKDSPADLSDASLFDDPRGLWGAWDADDVFDPETDDDEA